MNKKELQEALDRLRINHSDDCQQLNLDVFQEHINSLPDDYEPIPKEVKLSEILQRLKKELIIPEHNISDIYFKTIYNNCGSIWFAQKNKGFKNIEMPIIEIINNEIVTIALIFNEISLKWLYQLWINRTKIIDDLGEE